MYFLLFILGIIIGFLIWKHFIEEKYIKLNKEKLISKAEKRVKQQIDLYEKEYHHYVDIRQIQKESYERKKQERLEQAEKELERELELMRLEKEGELQAFYNSTTEKYDFYLQNYYTTIEEKKQILSNDLEQLKKQVEEYRTNQQLIQQEILRRREVEEQTDFYRICLPEKDKIDIQILRDIRLKLHNCENLDKMLYDNYLKKPTMEMIKRVLAGETACGIYKITRLKTGEIYIGKSTDIKSRWQQHVKTASNCGTIAHSSLHTIMEQDGIDNFTFEVIEKVPKDKLTEREKYWIDFFSSKKFGLNMRNG